MAVDDEPAHTAPPRRAMWHRAAQALRAHPRWSALILGLVSALGFPPHALWWLGMGACALFAALLYSARDWRSAGALGWLFGWGQLTLANNWIATAFTYQAEMPAALGWLAVPLLALYLALYPALAAILAHGLVRGGARGGADDRREAASPQSLSRALAFALALGASWTLCEWLRGWVFTGYPWPPLALMALGPFDRPGLAMILPWTGTYALSGLVIALCAALALALRARRFAIVSALSALIIAAMVWPAPRDGEARRPPIAVALVQPMIAQDQLNDPRHFEEHFARLARLTAPGSDQARLVLWPESAVPDYLRDGYPPAYYYQRTAGASPRYARERIARVIGPKSLVLLGAVDLRFEEQKGDGESRLIGAYNVITAIDGQGRIRAGYAKAHLVPYGEYLPMRALLEPVGLSRLVAGSIDFLPGPGPKTVDLGQFGRAGMQICYEIVFSGQVVDRANRPDYIFNPSNDGWFGAWGPPQHLAQARMRAIEEGLPVLRATTTGISAVIDARGVVRASIARGKAGRIDALVPRARASTLFARMGNRLALAWALALALGALAICRLATRRRAH